MKGMQRFRGRHLSRAIPICLAMLLVLVTSVAVSGGDPSPTAVSGGDPSPTEKIEQALLEKLRGASPADRFVAWAVFSDRPELDSQPDDRLPPVNEVYVDHATSVEGVERRWVDELLNAVSFEAPAGAFTGIARLPFVKEIREVPVGVVLAHNYGLLDTEISAIDVKLLHDAGYDGSGKRIAVLDTGVRITHVALSSKQSNLIWKDFVNDQPDPYDDHGHGTATAALAVGKDPGVWCWVFWCRQPYKGSAFNADLMALKIVDANEVAAMDDYNTAIQYAVQNGADVISVSLGWRIGIIKDGRSTAAMWTGWAVSTWGVPVIVAAGNEGTTQTGGSAIRTPGDNFNALTVGATSEDGQTIWAGSSNGPTADGRLKPDVVAPGDNVHIACITSDTCYDSGAGTSFATPLVAGAVASILEKKSWLSPAEIKATLRQTAIDGGAAGPDNVWGHGRIQANQASDANPDMDLAWDDGFTVETAFSEYTVSDFGYMSLRSMRFHGTTMVNAFDVPWVEAGGSGWIELDNSILFAGPYISEASTTSITLTTVYDPGCLRLTFSVRLTEVSSTQVKFEPLMYYNVCDQFSFRVNARFYLDFDIVGASRDYFQKIGSSQGVHYTFDSSDEGFAKETDYPYSDVRWDSANGRVYVKSDRRDAGDEMFTHGTEMLDTSTDFTVTARWRTTQQGNWQGAWPVFLAGQSNTQVNTANSVYIYYYSLDSNLQQNPRYYMQYRDGTNTLRLNVYYTALANTEYHLYIDYDASTQVLALEVRDVNDVTLASASYTIGSNPNDGFTFGKIGVSSDGWSGSSEPVTIAWTDDITLTSGGGDDIYYTETRIQGTNLYVRDTSSSEEASVYYRGSDSSPFEWLLRFPGSRDDPDGALTGQSIYSQNIVLVYESRKGSSKSGVIGPTIYLDT